MSDPTVPATPVLATIPNVELIHAGNWNISTGPWNVTADDLQSAVGAMDCPAVRRPVLKLGHTDPRFDGEPAVGWVANMATTDDGLTLVGDFTGMPAWLADIAASAYPDRSIEGQNDFRCQLGHTHPFVLTGVALLGVMAPGVGTLASLQDVAALYGIAAAADPSENSFVIQVKGEPMAKPVAASVSTDDIRQQYYESAPWSVWIIEQQIEPLQLIVQDDDNGNLARIPVTIGDADAVTFGTGIPVKRVYVDAPADVAASAMSTSLVFASRKESRPGDKPAVTEPPTTTRVAGTQKGAAMDAALLREALGVPADASDLEVQSALAVAGLVTPAAPVTDAPVAPVLTVVPEPVAASTDKPELAELTRVSAELAEMRAEKAADKRTAVFQAAISTGKIRPADRKVWEDRYDKAPEVTTDILSAMAAGTAVPVDAAGYTGDEEDVHMEDFDALHSRPAAKEA